MENTTTTKTITVTGPDGVPMTVTCEVTTVPPSVGQGALSGSDKAFVAGCERRAKNGPVAQCLPNWEKRAERMLGLDRQSASHRGELGLWGDE